MTIFIYICILALNILAIFMTYKFLGSEMSKKEKLIFIAVGIAIMYLTVSFVYWLSTKNVQLEAIKDTGKKIITFTFVPINSIITLPFFAKTYKKFKIGAMDQQKFKKYVIATVATLAIVLIIEFFYFQNIQNGILNIIQSAK